MLRVLLIDDERYSLEELACGLVNRLSETSTDFLVANSQIQSHDFKNEFNDIVKALLLERRAMTVGSPQEGLANVVHGEVTSIKPKILKPVVCTKPKRISLWKDGRISLVKVDKIACCFVQKAQRKVTVVAENKIYKSSDTLHTFLTKIEEIKLVRCHRSFAINPDYLLELLPEKNNTMVARVDGYSREIPVSRQYSHILRTIVGLRTRTDCK